MSILLKAYSVLLRYPDYIADDETWFGQVNAENPRHAAAKAQLECCEDNGWAIGTGRPNDEDALQDLDDLAVLLVIRGHHEDENPND